ncbi:helix-turn-helix domain-containing protein [Bacillus sp. REN16]|uniref:helix-turn-helix domain-containing protein n=1 Tax=Bacillus sp. REN16 TaxID=2887296 RepID=UPI001E60F982|nr:helix-turn-helix domain-containing protein [Bacillus sp. REN16]MCC3355452.1 helix-turn-helix domain-containing protein [Bacillus sp. REN16]
MKFKLPGSFFHRMILFVSILAIIPVIIVGIFSFIRSTSAVENYVAKEKEHSVYQIQTNVEQVIKSVDQSLTQLASSSKIIESLREPLTTRQFQLYNQLRDDLSHQQTFDTRLTDVALISVQNNWLVNNYGLQRLSEPQLQELSDRYLSLKTSSVWLLEKNTKDPLYKQVASRACGYNLNLIKKIPVVSSNKTGMIIANIPTCSFRDILHKDDSLETFYILDENENVVLHNDTGKIGQAFEYHDVLNENTSIKNDSGQFNITSDNTDYLFTYRKSFYNGWVYVSIVELNELTAQSRSIGWLTLAITLLIAGISLLLALFGSKIIYQPIKQLQNVILHSITNKEEQKDRNEFVFIENHVKDMLKQNDILEKSLQNQINQLKQFFTHRLLSGKVTEEELEGRMQYFGYNLDFNWLSVLTVQIDSFEGTSYKSKEEDVLLFVINGLVEELIPSDERMIPIVNKQTQVTLLLSNIDSKIEFNQYVNDIAEKIQKKVKEEYSVPVSIGVSEPFRNVLETRTGYKESLEALKYTLKFGTESIIFFENLEIGKGLHTYFPKRIENELFDSIKVNDKEKVYDLLNELIDEIFSEDLNHVQYQISLVRFLSDLIELMHTLAINVLDLEDNRPIFETIYEQKSREDVKEWFITVVIDPLLQQIEDRAESQYKSISENIVHIIHEEFESNITLDMIANRLHYNPNYLSSIFRKEMNISFSEYLSMYRINMAKKWLVETDISVKDISDKLNFNNSQNFIRSFKKIEGTTPGKYRESVRAQ